MLFVSSLFAYFLFIFTFWHSHRNNYIHFHFSLIQLFRVRMPPYFSTDDIVLCVFPVCSYYFPLLLFNIYKDIVTFTFTFHLESIRVRLGFATLFENWWNPVMRPVMLCQTFHFHFFESHNKMIFFTFTFHWSSHVGVGLANRFLALMTSCYTSYLFATRLLG